jgi:hypothetical protein
MEGFHQWESTPNVRKEKNGKTGNDGVKIRENTGEEIAEKSVQEIRESVGGSLVNPKDRKYFF